MSSDHNKTATSSSISIFSNSKKPQLQPTQPTTAHYQPICNHSTTLATHRTSLPPSNPSLLVPLHTSH